MKKKLLYLTSILLFSATSINAQTKVWDFGNDRTTFPLNSAGISTNTTIDLLGFFPGAAAPGNFGKVNSGSSGAFVGDAYTASTRLQLGGGGGTSTNKPLAKFLVFNVSGPCTVKVWGKTSTNGEVRTILVTNGTDVYSTGTGTTNSGGNADTAIATGTVTAAGTIYVYSDLGHNLYKIEVTGATVSATDLNSLSTDSFQSESNVAVYSSEGRINVSNVTSATKVSVYSVLGSLVKSAEVSADASLSIGSGLYIVKAQSAEGTKTVKVIVK